MQTRIFCYSRILDNASRFGADISITFYLIIYYTAYDRV